jgi:hypothetical protein
VLLSELPCGLVLAAMSERHKIHTAVQPVNDACFDHWLIGEVRPAWQCCAQAEVHMSRGTLYVGAGWPCCTGICTRVSHAQQCARCSGTVLSACSVVSDVGCKLSVMPAEQALVCGVKDQPISVRAHQSLMCGIAVSP